MPALLRCVVAALSFGLLLGCGGGGAPDPAAKSGTDGATKTYRIAVIPKGTTHEFWKSVHAGAEQAAKELGHVEILWKGALNEEDRDGQISIVQDFVTQKVDGICLAPLDSQALVPYVKEATEAKIPVVVFDSGLDAPPEVFASYVASDNHHGGQLAAERLAQSLGHKGNVILFRYNVGSDSTTQREEGFLSVIRKFPEMKVLSSDQYIGTSPEGSLTNAMNILGRHKDAVNGVFAVCEPNATGTLKALEELELAGTVKFVAFDPNAVLVEGLKTDKVHGIVLQDPVKMGYDAVKTVVAVLKGEKVEPRLVTGEHVATKENMDSPDMHKLLHPVQFED